MNCLFGLVATLVRELKLQFKLAEPLPSSIWETTRRRLTKFRHLSLRPRFLAIERSCSAGRVRIWQEQQ
jgi:hypothetical protein